MAEKVTFQIDFEANQRNLREVRRQLEQSITGLSAEFSARVSDIAGERGGRGQRPVTGGVQSNVARTEREIGAATEDLIAAIQQRATAERQIKTLVDSTVQFTREDNQELQRLTLIRKSAERRINDVIGTEEQLIPVLRNFQAALNQAGSELLEGAGTAAGELNEGIRANVRSLRDVRRRNELQSAAQARLSRVTESAFRVLQFTEGALEAVGRDATAFTRPVRRLSERSQELALQFSSAGNNLRETIGRLAGRDIGLDEFRNAVRQAGGDLVKTISNVLNIDETLIQSSNLFKDAVSRIESEFSRTQASERELQRETRDLAASRRRLSQERQQNLRRVFNEVTREQEQQAVLEKNITSARQKVLDEQDKLVQLLERQFSSEIRNARERQRGQGRRTSITPEDLRRAEIVEQATSVVDNLRSAADAIGRARTERIPERIDEIGREALKLRTQFQRNEEQLAAAGRRLQQLAEQQAAGGQGAGDTQAIERERAQLERRRLDLIRQNNNILLREGSLEQESQGLIQQQATLQEEQNRIQRQIVQAQRDELNARTEVARRERQRGRGGGGGGVNISTPQQIEAFSRNLDTRGLERFVGILRNTERGLSAANTQLKAHQGNIAKSNILTEELTASLNSGQRAAFQFGFAAANAAERLAAWASPAAFIFQALNLLRQSVTEVVRIDAEIRRVAFFDRATLDNIAQGITQVGEATFDIARDAEVASGAFGRLSNQAQRLQALNSAASTSFELLGRRALEVGIPLERLTELALTAGRVGRGAFNFDTGEPTNFFLAAEAALRLEGSAANATTVVAQLNSVLNQFQLTGDDAVTTVALISEAVGQSAFGFQELLDILARVGGSFRALQGADIAESIETIRFFSERANVSIGQVSTAIRQLSTGVVRAREEFGLFSEVAQIDREGITSLDGLVSVLRQVEDLRGTPELESFLSLFSERRIQTNIINFANNIEELEGALAELGDTELRVARAQAAVNNLLAQSAFQAQSAQAEVERFNTQITLFGRAAGFDELQSSLARIGTQLASVATLVVDAFGGIAPLIAAAAGALAPFFRQIFVGFRAGLLQSQNQQIAIGNITRALGEERNAVKAINVAERERIVTAQQATQFRQQAISLISQEIPLERQLTVLKQEQLVLEKSGVQASVRLEQVKAQINALEQQRLSVLRQQQALESQIQSTVGQQSAQVGSALRRNLPSIIGGAALLGGQLAAQTVGGAFEDRKTGDAISSAISSAIAGGVTGSVVGGPIGAAIGAGLGVIGSIVSARQESARAAEQERVAQEQSNLAAQRQLTVLENRQNELQSIREKASQTEAEILDLQTEQQLVQIEIQRVGEQKAADQGLFNDLLDIEKSLSQARVRLGREEEAQLQAKLAFERQIVEVRERGQIIEQTIATIRDAQISLLEREGELETVARVKFQFDELSIQNQRRILEEELSDTAIRIQQLTALGGTQNEQELRNLTRERERLAGRLNRLELETVQRRFRNQLQILDASERQTRDTIQRFRQAGDSVAKAISDSIGLQRGIADAIRSQGEFVNNILDAQLERAERALSARGTGLNEQQRLERQVALQRAFLQQQLNNVNRIFQRQRRALRETASLDEIEDQVDSVIGSLQLLEEQQDATSNSEKIILQEREAIFAREQAILQNQLSAIQNEINARQQNARDIIENARNRIETEELALEAIKKRAELEEENADRLLDAPDELLNSIRDVVTARNFIQAVRGGAENEDRELRQLLRDQRRGQAVDPAELARAREESFIRQLRRVIERNGVGNRAILQQVRDGLQEAVTQGAVLAEGFSPEDLLSVFRRSLVGDARTLNDSLSEQEQINNNIQGLLKEVESFTGEQGRLADLSQSLLQQQERIADEQRRLNELQVTELQNQVRTAVQNSNTLAEEVKGSAENIIGLQAKLEDLLGTDVATEGERQIKSSVDKVADILSTIASATGSTTELQRINDEFVELIRNLGGRGELTDSSLRELESALSRTALAGTENLAARGDRGRVTEDSIREIIGGLIVSALQSGNIGGVSGLLAQGGDTVVAGQLTASGLQEIANILGVNAEQLANLVDQLSPGALKETLREGNITDLEDTIGAVEVLNQDINTLLGELLNILPQGALRLDQLRDLLGDRASTLEAPVLDEQRRIAAEQARIQEQAKTASIEAIQDGIRTRQSLEALVAVINSLVQQGGNSLQNTEAIISSVNNLVEQARTRGERVADQPSVTQLDQDSLDRLRDVIDTTFGEAGERFKQTTSEVLNQPLNIDFGEIVVKLNAEILQNIQGEEFAAQITEALTGTGLEDRVGLIQDILTSLVRTELERGNTDIPTGAFEGIGAQ